MIKNFFIYSPCVKKDRWGTSGRGVKKIMFYEMTLWGFGLNPVVCPTAPRRKKSVVVKTTQNAPHCADTNVRMHTDVKQGLSYGPEAISLCLRFLFYIFFGGNTIKKHPKVFFYFCFWDSANSRQIFSRRFI